MFGLLQVGPWHTADELAEVLRYAANAGLPCVTLGRGTNTLFDDRGFDGVVAINCIDHLDRVEPTVNAAGAGRALNKSTTISAKFSCCVYPSLSLSSPYVRMFNCGKGEEYKVRGPNCWHRRERGGVRIFPCGGGVPRQPAGRRAVPRGVERAGVRHRHTGMVPFTTLPLSQLST